MIPPRILLISMVIFIIVRPRLMVYGFGMNLIRIAPEDHSQIVCTVGLLRKYFHSGESLSGSLLSMTLTSATMNIQQSLLKAIHANEEAWSVVVKRLYPPKISNDESDGDAEDDAMQTPSMESSAIQTSTSVKSSVAILHEKPQCYFVVIENLEDDDMELIFEDWRTTVNWNPMAQFVVFLASVEESDEEMTELMTEILLGYMNRKIFNVNVIGQNEENGYYYGKTVFPYHPDNNCGNRVITMETLDICDFHDNNENDDYYGDDDDYDDDEDADVDEDDGDGDGDGEADGEEQDGDSDNEDPEDGDEIGGEDEESDDKDANDGDDAEEGGDEETGDEEEVTERDEDKEEEGEKAEGSEGETETKPDESKDEAEGDANQEDEQDDPDNEVDNSATEKDDTGGGEDVQDDYNHKDEEGKIDNEGGAAEDDPVDKKDNTTAEKDKAVDGEDDNVVEQDNSVGGDVDQEKDNCHGAHDNDGKVGGRKDDEKITGNENDAAEADETIVSNDGNVEVKTEEQENTENKSHGLDENNTNSKDSDENKSENDSNEKNEMYADRDNQFSEGNDYRKKRSFEEEDDEIVNEVTDKSIEEEVVADPVTIYDQETSTEKPESTTENIVDEEMDADEERKHIPIGNSTDETTESIKTNTETGNEDENVEDSEDKIPNQDKAQDEDEAHEHKPDEDDENVNKDSEDIDQEESMETDLNDVDGNEDEEKNDDDVDANPDDDGKSEKSNDTKVFIEEFYRALFLDKFPHDLSGCPLVAAYRPWEPYIFNERNGVPNMRRGSNDDDADADRTSFLTGTDVDVDEEEESSDGTNFNTGNEDNNVGNGGESWTDDEPFTSSQEEDRTSDKNGDSDESVGERKRINLSGIEYMMVEAIAERLHISIEIKLENKNLYHLFQMLIDGDIEMIVGGIDEDPSISQFVSSTVPYHQDDLTWCVARAKRKYSLFNFLQIFRIGTWSLTVMFVVATALIVQMAQRVLHVRLWRLRGFFTMCVQVMGIVVSQSMPLRFVPITLRITLATAFFMSLMFNSLYQSFLVSTLTTPRSSGQIKKLAEVYQHRMTIMGSVDNVRHLNKDGEIFKYIREKFQMCYNIEECLKRAAHDEHIAVAVSRQHSFYNPRIPRDHLFCFDRDENLYVYLVTMLLPKKFHLLHKINPIIQHIIESGHMQKWARDLDMKRKIKDELHRVREEPFKSLTLAQIGGSFVFSGILLSVAVFVFSLERWTFWMVMRKRTRLKIPRRLHAAWRRG